jgi:hypothetical protein
MAEEDRCDDEGVMESGKDWLGCAMWRGVTVRGEARRPEEKKAESVVVIFEILRNEFDRQESSWWCGIRNECGCWLRLWVIRWKEQDIGYGLGL